MYFKKIQSLTFVLLLFSLCVAQANVPTQLNNGVTPTDESNGSLKTEEIELYNYRDRLKRDTPRGALSGFMDAVYNQDYDKAAKYLDVRYLPAKMEKSQAPIYAKQLQAIIDRNIWINFEQINDTPNGASNDHLPDYRDIFATIIVNGEEVDLFLQTVPSKRLGKLWKISNTTVAEVPKLYEQLGYGPLAEWFISQVPDGYFLKLKLWEWALFAASLVSAFMVVLPITWLIQWLLLRSQYQLKKEMAALVAGPLRLFLTLAINRTWLMGVSLSAVSTELLESGVGFILAIFWLGWSLFGLLKSFLSLRLTAKGNKQGASLVRPLMNVLRFVILLIAFLIWLEYLGFNASAILAGMGIGGIAIALASKQSVENLIGTLTLYSAAPIKVGNLCKFGSMRGTVEEIGLRCTRIRTIDRTVIHVPNAKLAEMEIENISEREKIRFKTDLRLEYGTTTEQLKAIIADIKAIFEAHEKVDEKPLRVTFKGFGEYGLEVKVFAYIKSKSLPVYQVAAQELQFGIMEIIEKHGSRLMPATALVAAASGGAK